MPAINLPSKAERGRILRFLAGGLSTTLLNILLFAALSRLIPSYKTANLIAIVLTKLYAFFINKLFVFRSRRLTPKQQLRELVTYILTRGFTGVVDYFGLALLVSGAGFDPFWSKVFIQGIVILLNYVMGRFIVFKAAAEPAEQDEEA